MPPVYHRHGAGEALELIDDMVSLYEAVFAEAPYYEGAEHVVRFRGLYEAECDQPGFRLIGAWCAGTLVGMAYGFTRLADVWWRDAGEPPPGLAGRPMFAVMELAVHPDLQRRGIGRALHDRLLDRRTESMAMLKVLSAVPARFIYLRWGWRSSGELTGPDGDRVEILTLPLS